MKTLCILAVVLLQAQSTLALAPESTTAQPSSRRQLFSRAASTFGLSSAAAAAFLTTATTPAPAWAADKSPPSPEDLARIKKGYEQIRYLLDNFDEETTVCNPECKRNADAIRKVMGLRSTTDTLFQIEKVFDKVKYMDLDPDKLDALYEATEDWNSATSMSNSMAFVSQFGEYNPGGGKDNVLKYLNESKKQVVLAETSLKTILDCLEIK